MFSQQSNVLRPRRLVGLDIGRKVIGVALADSRARLAFPFDIWSFHDEKALLENLQELEKQYRIEGVVMGIPPEENVSLREFILSLEKALSEHYEVHLVNEHVSTIEAQNRAVDTGMEPGRYDSIAAQIILERYFEYE